MLVGRQPDFPRLPPEPTDQNRRCRIACEKQHTKDQDRQKGIQILVPEQDPSNRRRYHERRQNQRRQRICNVAAVPAKDTDFQRTHDQLVHM